MPSPSVVESLLTALLVAAFVTRADTGTPIRGYDFRGTLIRARGPDSVVFPARFVFHMDR